MQVILQEDYPGLGFVGDVVKVRTGFARNYLIPKKIALPALDSNVKMLEHKKRVLDVKKAEKKKDALRYQERLQQAHVVIQHAAGEGEKLFGSVTAHEIHDALLKSGFEIDRKLIKLEAPIKTVGEHTIEIKLHQEVTAAIKVMIERPEEQRKEAKDHAEKKEVKTRAPRKPKEEKIEEKTTEEE
jgi:large subunit ribosomal protein L9